MPETTVLNPDGKSIKVTRVVESDIKKEDLVTQKTLVQAEIDRAVAKMKAVDDKLGVFR